jgi:hypothetical protein
MSVMEDLTKTVEDATTVEESVHHLLTGVFRSIKEALATGNIAGVEQCVNDHMHAAPGYATAVGANTSPPDPAADPVPVADDPAPAEDEGSGEQSQSRNSRGARSRS